MSIFTSFIRQLFGRKKAELKGMRAIESEVEKIKQKQLLRSRLASMIKMESFNSYTDLPVSGAFGFKPTHKGPRGFRQWWGT